MNIFYYTHELVHFSKNIFKRKPSFNFISLNHYYQSYDIILHNYNISKYSPTPQD